MNWTDDAILLSATKVARSALLIDTLTRRHGRCLALLPLQGKSDPLLLPGSFLRPGYAPNVGQKPGRGALLGTSGGIIADSGQDIGLIVLTAIQELSVRLLPLSEPVPKIYDAVQELIWSLLANDRRWPVHYTCWEFALLSVRGYVTGIERCLPAFRHGEAIYLSPRGATLVTREEAGAFLDRMLPVPGYLFGGSRVHIAELRQGVALLQFLAERFVFSGEGGDQPRSRALTVSAMGEYRTIPWKRTSEAPILDERARNLRLLSSRPLTVPAGLSKV